MMRVASGFVAFVGVGMIVAVVSNDLLEEGGVFVIVWIAVCVGIIGFALYMAFSRKGVGDVLVSIKQEGDLSNGAGSESVETRLKTLDAMKLKGLVSEEEYRKQREKIIQSV